jgi:integrase
MQHGSLSREQRKRSSDVWSYRWWESGPTGRRIHRRIILGTVEQLNDKRAANQATVGLRREINSHDIRTKTTLMTVAELANHFRQRELLDSNMRITCSTKKAYAGCLTKWIVPRWGQNALQYIKARGVELWLASVQRARSTRAKIRNVMSVLFNHARRYDLFDGNPIQWVRQSAKRRSAPNVLTIDEVQHLLAALPSRERILVFLDVSTGLRQSELFGLQWQDIDFEIGELRVTRSVVGQVVGTCKTEASQKAIPLHEDLIEALKGWRQQNPYKEAQHWVFASPSSGGKNPYRWTTADAPGHPPGCREAGDHQAHRMAYLPAHVLHIASGRGSGSESNAGTAATLHDPCDFGYLHPRGDSRQAYSPHRGSLFDCWKWRIKAV